MFVIFVGPLRACGPRQAPPPPSTGLAAGPGRRSALKTFIMMIRAITDAIIFISISLFVFNLRCPSYPP